MALLADDPPEMDEAKAAFKAGTEAYSAGDYRAASDAFQRAYNYHSTWKLLYNIAQSEIAAKRYGVALEYFEQYMAEGGDDIPVERSTQVMAEIQRLRLLVGTIDLTGPEGATLYVDDFERGTTPFVGPRRIAIGKHMVRVESDGRVLLEKEIFIAGGMTTAISTNSPETKVGPKPPEADNAPDAFTTDPQSARMPPPVAPNPRWLLIGGTISTALGIGGIVTGAIFASKLSTANDDWEEAKRRYELTGLEADFARMTQRHDDAEGYATGVKVGFIAGGVLVAGGVVMMIVDFKRVGRRSRISLETRGMTVTF
ncbi:MAG: PEGA domain-containing protein [Deltaproteobacteria bacterium]|nr:PEGA domain-containing protein [Deltaproteobacteria bacterium]